MQVDEIEEMQDQLESYRTKVVSLENEKKTLLEQSQQLHVELAAAKELTSQQSVQLDSSAVEISTLLNKLSESSAAHNLTSEKLKATEMELRRTISTMEEIKRTAKTQLLQAEQFVNQQNHTISVVKEREAVTTGKFKAVEAELTRTKELHSQLQEQYDSANESLGAITSEVNDDTLSFFDADIF
ncbi:hypothetical protein BDR26DRAFT_476137 [Obelidium mucronatum]|nr:hypothetical protein BDR26DRAFT_476137 [Obelidium mucronatum]